MTAVRTRIEDAVIARLQGLESSGTVWTIRPYNGQLALKQDDDIMTALGGLLPGVLVTTSVGRFKGWSVSRRIYHREIEIILYLASGSQDEPEERTRGANQIYELEDAILERMIGFPANLGTGVAAGHLEPVSEEVLIHDKRLCVWKQTWSLTVEAELAEPLAETVTEVLGSHNFPAEDDNAADPVVQVSSLF